MTRGIGEQLFQFFDQFARSGCPISGYPDFPTALFTKVGETRRGKGVLLYTYSNYSQDPDFLGSSGLQLLKLGLSSSVATGRSFLAVVLAIIFSTAFAFRLSACLCNPGQNVDTVVRKPDSYKFKEIGRSTCLSGEKKCRSTLFSQQLNSDFQSAANAISSKKLTAPCVSSLCTVVSRVPKVFRIQKQTFEDPGKINFWVSSLPISQSNL